MKKNIPADPLSATGIAGLDDILNGGLTPSRIYLIEGDPGSGKTTLAIQYLREGVRRGEPTLYVTLSETKEELHAVAASHGWGSIEALNLIEILADEDELEPDNQHTMFQPADIELGKTTKRILSEIDRIKPKRVVIDSLSELRLLAQSSLRYRRQILALKQYFIGRECTVLLLEDKTSEANDLQVQSIAHGVVSLEQRSPVYGAERRRLRITKLRGQRYRGGYHDFNIATGGLDVFPRLVASEHREHHVGKPLKSGVEELDKLLGGGVDYGTCTLLIGPAGSGKSSLATSYAKAAAMRGERAALFVFDERIDTLLKRSKGLGMDLAPHLEARTISIQSVDPAEMSPGEFAHSVRAAVDGTDGYPPAKVVVIDSLNGYLQSMPEEHLLTAQLHELLTYLGHKGVGTFLILAQQGMLGQMQSPVDTTYLADSVILFRFFESQGVVCQAVAVLKKRSGRHERTIREFRLDGGIRVGKPLIDFDGILTGTPVYRGTSEELLRPRNG